MNEQKVKKRGWVKNAAIIFLSVLLVLTFFSQTIMNRSLPEVVAQYVQSGTISTQIRGSGTVTAAESFEVKSSLSRQVLSVPVKVGDAVSVGDTLLLYSEAASEELKAAQDALDALVLSYQKALINAASGQYSSERLAVSEAQDALDEAKATRDANAISDSDLYSAQAAVNAAKTQVAICEAALAKAEADLAALGGPQEGSAGDYSTVIAAKNMLDALKLLYNEELYKAQTGFFAIVEAERKTTSAAVYAEYLAMEYSKYKDAPDTEPENQYKYRQSQAYYAVKEAEDAYNSALAAYNAATSGSNMVEYNKRLAAVATAEGNLKIANNSLAAYEVELKKLQEKKETYDAAVKAVTAAQKALQLALSNLEKSIALENLDLDQMRKDIEEQNELIESMRSGGEGNAVTSLVSGIVTAVNVVAGSTAEANSTLMVVEVPDMGYTVSFPVTNEQSQKVRVGDSGTVLYSYWGSSVTANLAAIRTNPENPMTSKMLVFKVSGDVQSGSQLTISIGERGANYNAIVPNSALRSDSNGDFVLIVEARSTALGNRYKAVRVDVQILAKDDSNTAVSGGVTANDFVITSASVPIEPGMQVRLPD